MRVLQGNLHRSRTADALLDQVKLHNDADLLIISEQYRDRSLPEWYSDNLGTAAIWIPYPNVSEAHGSENGFVWVKINGVIYVSCYFTPNEPVNNFRAKIDSLEDKVREMEDPVIIAGDFNAKALEWGMNMTDSRGHYILDMLGRLGLTVMNEGRISTFRRPGYAETIPDITLASDTMARYVTGWRVIEDYTGSDHQYITYDVQRGPRRTARSTLRAVGWNVNKLSQENFARSIEAGKNAVLEETGSPEKIVKSTMALIKQACDASMPRKRTKCKRTAVYWWSNEIAELRASCLHLKRVYTRSRKRNESAAERHREEFRIARRALKSKIKESKRRKWEELKRDVDVEPWGLGYKIIMRKLGSQAPSPLMDAEQMWQIVDSLFPNQQEQHRPPCPDKTDEVPLFTEEELREAAYSLQSRKAPGPDMIPSEVLKALVQCHPDVLLNTFNHCLKEGVFPRDWKNQRLVLINKKSNNTNAPPTYRPLCMLDTAGKLLERLIKSRLAVAIQTAGGLSCRQYGFRKGRSTVNAIEEVVSTFNKAQQGNHYSRKIMLLVTLDVKNAFNSARWPDILTALTDVFKIPNYMLRVLHSYLQDRTLIFETNEGQCRKVIQGGVAQGSILGPELWNILYDGILRMEMPDDVFMVGYADDIAAVISTRNTEEAQRKVNQVMRRCNSWLHKHGLTLATEKTELLLLTRRQINTEVMFRVNNQDICTKTEVKYLGIYLDTKMSFWEQIKRSSEKASKAVCNLSRLMSNVSGPMAGKRRLLMSVTNSILLYGCEVWADALKMEKYRKKMATVQRRGALRVTSAYRTVSEAAALVIAGTIPIDLMAQERKKNYSTRNTRNTDAAEARTAARIQTLQLWQERWEAECGDRWTASLIRNLRNWTERKHGEVNYYLTQFLTGHGYFCKYLHTIGKLENSSCIYGDADIDDARHTFFICEKWKPKREELLRKIGDLAPETVIESMLDEQWKWETVTQYAEDILKSKKHDLDEYLATRNNT